MNLLAGNGRAGNRRAGIAIALVLTAAGCTDRVVMPDQSGFTALAVLAEQPEAVARVYVADTRFFGMFFTHPWLLTKRSDSDTFDRWEVTSRPGGPLGHVRPNLRELDWYFNQDVYVLAELVGEDAREIVAVIERQAPRYPCRFEFSYFPGPNSNTFAQWVIDQAGWDVQLPSTSIGRGHPADCAVPSE